MGQAPERMNDPGAPLARTCARMSHRKGEVAVGNSADVDGPFALLLCMQLVNRTGGDANRFVRASVTRYCCRSFPSHRGLARALWAAVIAREKAPGPFRQPGARRHV